MKYHNMDGFEVKTKIVYNIIDLFIYLYELQLALLFLLP